MAHIWRVLSIDGGGIRGIIPATVLSYIEAKTGQPVCRLFDLVAGTSTGGILALGLTKPSPTAPGHPQYSAQELIALYEQEGPTIFPGSTSLCRRVRQIVRPKYSAEDLERILARYFDGARLSDSLTDVLVTAYDIERRLPFFFKSRKAKNGSAGGAFDFAMRDAALSTAAAPTFFPPTRITPVEPGAYYALIDGGVFAGNPAMCAFAEAKKHLVRNDDKVLLVSIGTGKCDSRIAYDEARSWGALKWVLPLLDIGLGGSDLTVDYQLRQILATENYFRFQKNLEVADEAMDNATPGNLRALKLEGETMVRANQADLDRLSSRLLELHAQSGKR